MENQIQDIITKALVVAREAGTFLRNEIGRISHKDIQTKGTHDFVTYVDKTSESILVEKLKQITPNAGFITEEKTVKTELNKELVWIIDPLDGTTNYIHKLAPYSISIALLQNNKLCGGIIYEVSHNEMFYAWKNGGAFLNGNQIKVSNTSKVYDSLIATGFPFRDYSLLDNYMNTLKYFMEKSLGLRRLGSAAVDLAYVACGRFDAFYEYSLKSWDVAAGAFIVQEAGGKISDFKGGENYLFGEEIIAANSLIYNEFSTIIKNILFKK